MLKRIIVMLAAALLLNGAAFAVKIDDISRSFFPDVKRLNGGEELWLNTGITQKDFRTGVKYSTHYSHYSPRAETLMDIRRKKTFDVYADVYAFNNFVKAHNLYKELTSKLDNKKTQEISFGDRGVFTYVPKSSYINDADFTIVFMNKIFVAEIKADDGFALMDVAAHVNMNMQNFILANLKMFLVKNLTLAVSADGYEEIIHNFTFTDDSPAEVTVSGQVFGEGTEPVAGTEITILETGDSVLTDIAGKYSYTVEIEGGEKNLSFSKNFYMEKLPGVESAAPVFSGGVFDTRTSYSKDNKTIDAVWRLDRYGDNLFGEALIDISGKKRKYPLNGKVEKGQVNISLDCQRPGSSFKCEQTFEGFLTDEFVSGTWHGTGGGGTWRMELDSYGTETEYVYLDEAVSSIERVGLSAEEYNLRPGMPYVAASDEVRNGFFVRLNRDKLGLGGMFVKGASLVLSHLPNRQSGMMRIYSYDSMKSPAEKGYAPGTMTYITQLFEKDEPYSVEVDMTNYIHTPGMEGVLIAPLLQGDGTGYHLFGGYSVRPEAYRPKLKIERYVQAGGASPIELFLQSGMGKDVVSERNVIRSDGRADITIEAVIRRPGERLESVEIISGGELKKVWNTDPLDIYPAIGLIRGKELLNKADGSIAWLIEKPEERLSLHISSDPGKGARFRIKIGGEWYEGDIKRKE
ncbi:hypothetical protein [Limisalsivibrio acetivorans]|uniref:hypothetical protein n=1 Tax=Limisalsivibrio acetivorans TaxID=1304888 RepID=UPI0003B2E9E2|nr:hypothetical protein [Limisalsivibrio acetivorans]